MSFTAWLSKLQRPVTACFLACATFGACRVTFDAKPQGADQLARRLISIPSAIDATATGGQSARLTSAVRLAMTSRPEFELTPIETAHLALDLQIENITTQVVEVDECEGSGDSFRGSMAGGAYPCSQVARTQSQASVASREEKIVQTVLARAVALNTGEVVFSKRYVLASPNFDVIGSANTRAGLRQVPELHSLRYFENRDLAVENVATVLANDLKSRLLKIRWPR